MAAVHEPTLPPKPPDPQKRPSFASMVSKGTGSSFAQSTDRHEGSLEPPLKRCEWRNGRLVIAFNQEELQQSMEPLRFVLVAKFWGPRPSVDEVRSMIRQTWELSEEIFVGVLNSNHLLLRFSNKEDYIRSWLLDTHVIKGIYFKVFPWSPLFRPGLESPLSPVWINLPLLPCNLFEKKFLSSVVSGVGRLLAIDQPTASRTRPSMARVCVEVDLAKPLPHEIDIYIGSSIVVQKIVYEKLPSYCRRCRIRGHVLNQCPRNKNDSVMNNMERGTDISSIAVNNKDKGAAVSTAVASDEHRTEKVDVSTVPPAPIVSDGFVKVKARNWRRNKHKEGYVVQEGKLKEGTKQWVSRVFYSRAKTKKRLWVPRKDGLRTSDGAVKGFDESNVSDQNDSMVSDYKAVMGNGDLSCSDVISVKKCSGEMKILVEKAMNHFTNFEDVMALFAPKTIDKKLVLNSINEWIENIGSMGNKKIQPEECKTISSHCVIEEIVHSEEDGDEIKVFQNDGESGEDLEEGDVSNNVNCGELLAGIKVFQNDHVEMEENDGGELEYPNQNVKVSEDVVNRNLLVKSKSMDNIVEACGDKICDRGHESEGEIKKTAIVPKEVFVQESSQLIKKLSEKFWRKRK